MGLVRIGPRVSRRTAMHTGRILTEILLNIPPEEFRKSGRGREYFEERMLGDWFPDLTEDEKALVLSLTKAVLDRAFPA